MIAYTDSLDGVTVDMLAGFFVGWPNPPSPETHLKILQQADLIELAIDGESGRVVGFLSGISDGVMSAYLPLLEVLPEYQGKGIGSELLRRMLARLKDLYMVDLTCDTKLQPYYERFGLRRSTGMMIRDFDRQSCE